MRRLTSILLVLACVLGTAHASFPTKYYTNDFSNAAYQWDVRVSKWSTPRLQFSLIERGTTTFDATGYTATYLFKTNNDVDAMVSVTGTVSSSTVTFNITNNVYSVSGSDFYSALTLSTGDTTVTWSRGKTHISKAPEINATSGLPARYAVYGPSYGPFTGDFSGWPFLETDAASTGAIQTATMSESTSNAVSKSGTALTIIVDTNYVVASALEAYYVVAGDTLEGTMDVADNVLTNLGDTYVSVDASGTASEYVKYDTGSAGILGTWGSALGLGDMYGASVTAPMFWSDSGIYAAEGLASGSHLQTLGNAAIGKALTVVSAITGRSDVVILGTLTVADPDTNTIFYLDSTMAYFGTNTATFDAQGNLTLTNGAVLLVDGTNLLAYMVGLTNATVGHQPLDATLTDIADGTIAENLVNTANPWADDEVANALTVDDAGIAATIARDSEVTSATGGLHTIVSAEIDADVTAHAGAADPHAGYVLESATGTWTTASHTALVTTNDTRALDWSGAASVSVPAPTLGAHAVTLTRLITATNGLQDVPANEGTLYVQGDGTLTTTNPTTFIDNTGSAAFTLSDFTFDGTTNTLDVSAYVPANARKFSFRVLSLSTNTTAATCFLFPYQGSDYRTGMRIKTRPETQAGATFSADAQCTLVMDTNQCIKYWATAANMANSWFFNIYPMHHDR